MKPPRGKSIAALAVALCATAANADEGGVSFWLPGEFGSLAAAPLVPGWAVGFINIYNATSASGAVAAAREITIGNLNPTVKVNLNLNLAAKVDLALVSPSYVFATPVLGGQLAVSLAGAVGRPNADINGTLTLSAGPITITKQGEISDSRWGVADLFPQASLRWNNGVNSWMLYTTGDVPVGTYDRTRLANVGLGHGAADGGAGYTYFDPATGHEFSVVTGLTYNFVNPSTNYQNGIDWHVDWGASQFLTKTWQVGAVGYFFQQLTADKGCAPILCPFKTRVAGIGPQMGFIFPAGEMQGYLNLKGYRDFDAENRAPGWSVWVSLAFSPKPPEAPAPSSRH
ncbi:MAG TPA: transporter [Xanthobacteraceae bacterium]|jgi:hypothetical protein